MNENVKIILGLLGGLALFLFGMKLMSESLKKTAGSKIKAGMAALGKNPLLGILVGAFSTAILQSSSATTVMVIGFVSAGVMTLPVAIAIIFGANIGTTITASLASVGQSKNAKRSAAAHSLFNISGALIFICLIPFFAKLVQAVSPKGTEVSVISRQIANAHTMFNAAMTLIWMPLLGVMVRIVTTLVKDGEPKKKEPITDIASLLNYRLLNEPESALLLIQSKVETALDFANITKEKLAAQEIGDEQEFFDEVLFVQREAERLMGYFPALIATNNLTDDQAVLCEELIIKLHKAVKKSVQ